MAMSTTDAHQGRADSITGFDAVIVGAGFSGFNIADKPRTFLPYLDPGGVGGYRKRCDDVAAKGYEGFLLGS